MYKKSMSHGITTILCTFFECAKHGKIWQNKVSQEEKTGKFEYFSSATVICEEISKKSSNIKDF